MRGQTAPVATMWTLCPSRLEGPRWLVGCSVFGSRLFLGKNSDRAKPPDLEVLGRSESGAFPLFQPPDLSPQLPKNSVKNLSQSQTSLTLKLGHHILRVYHLLEMCRDLVSRSGSSPRAQQYLGKNLPGTQIFFAATRRFSPLRGDFSPLRGDFAKQGSPRASGRNRSFFPLGL